MRFLIISKQKDLLMCTNSQCQSKEYKVLYYSDGWDNIDKMPHAHVACSQCGFNYNIWEIGNNKIKKSFGENAELYL